MHNTQTPRCAGVIGWPIAHSRSPRIHGYWLEQHNINGTYEAVAIEPNHLEAEVARLVASGWAGFNVTVPHKENIMKLLHTLSDDARMIGAVNTVVVQPDGTLYGHNTDAFGFTENLREAAPQHDLSAGPALVLGAGGAARAVLTALIAAGVPDIYITNRTHARAQLLAADFVDGPARLHVVPWDVRTKALKGCHTLVNTTSLGMKGQDALDMPLDKAPSDMLVHDIVYAPLMTPLLEAATARGLPTVTGIGMLLHQARWGFSAWFGVMPEVDDALRVRVLAP